MAEKLIVVGRTAVGLNAAFGTRKEKPDMEIRTFEKSGLVSYGTCGLPYFVGGLIRDINDLVVINAESLKNMRNILAWIHHEMLLIDPEKKEVSVKDPDTDQVNIHSYDKLVIATDAVPMVPPIPGIHSNGVCYPRNMEDGICLKAAVRKHRRICIIGGGAIGLKAAEELGNAGLSVSVYEQSPRLLPFLDNVFSQTPEDVLIKYGINVHTGTQIAEILSEDGKASGIRTVFGEVEPSDIILISVGVELAGALAEQAGFALGLKGGIVVDGEMRTSHKGTQACGGCAQMKNRATGKPTYVPLGTAANKQGRVADGDMTGGHDTFKEVLGLMITKVFELFTTATGLSKEQAAGEGYDAILVSVTEVDRASYYSGDRNNHICLIVDKKTSRLLGTQGIGSEGIAGRVNALTTVITYGTTVEEINGLDLIYAPSAVSVYDPILITASQVAKKVTEQTVMVQDGTPYSVPWFREICRPTWL